MALVAVVDLLLDAELLECEYTADTEENLLLQTVLVVATIESVSNRAVELRVHIVVCIEQVELDATNVHSPYVCVNLIAHVRYVNNHRLAVLVEHALYWQRVEVLSVVLSDLLTVHRQSLLEVAVTIEETYTAHVYVRVRSLLHIVACKHTETTRVDLHNLVDTVLHTEVSHRWTCCVWLNIHVVAELLVYLLYRFHDGLILHDSLLALIAQAVEKHYRVVTNLFIEIAVKALPHVASLIVPRPPHVVCELIKTLQL